MFFIHTTSIPPPTVTPPTPTIPPDCPAQSQSCQRILEKVVNVTSDVELRRVSVSDFCSSVCSDLAQKRPECFLGGILGDSTVLVQTNTICSQRTDRQLCGVIIYSEQTFAFIRNISRDCFSPQGIAGINCTHSSCVNTYQAYLNHLGCCAGTGIRDLENSGLNISLLISCLEEIQIPSPCPGKHANHVNSC